MKSQHDLSIAERLFPHASHSLTPQEKAEAAILALQESASRISLPLNLQRAYVAQKAHWEKQQLDLVAEELRFTAVRENVLAQVTALVKEVSISYATTVTSKAPNELPPSVASPLRTFLRELLLPTPSTPYHKWSDLIEPFSTEMREFAGTPDGKTLLNYAEKMARSKAELEFAKNPTHARHHDLTAERFYKEFLILLEARLEIGLGVVK